MISNTLFSSKNIECYTPANIINLALEVMDVNEFDLDPCSPNVDGSGTCVPAKTYYTKETDGLKQEWFGKVWMNPPYGKEIMSWTNKLVHEYETGNVTEAIALVPARTDTKWFQTTNPTAICCIRGRIKFLGQKNSAPFPSLAIYFGQDFNRFNGVFSRIGNINVPLSTVNKIYELGAGQTALSDIQCMELITTTS